MATSVDIGLAKLQELRDVVGQIGTDGSKFFERGNKAAGIRARKLLQDVKHLAQELRVAIQRCKNEGTQGGTPIHKTQNEHSFPESVQQSMGFAHPQNSELSTPSDVIVDTTFSSGDFVPMSEPAVDQQDFSSLRSN